VTGWLSDVLRLVWGAFYWNARKTWHVARGRRGACPCHVASDSGRARETGCEAAIGYRSPARFRTVCPLLERKADGAWVCSVNSEQVRPFWGRASLIASACLLALGLITSAGVFGLLRGIGYDIRYAQVVWPPAWREFRTVQAAYHLEKAREAQSAGRIAESILYLSNAYELNPRDPRPGLLLAQLWQVGQPLLSDQTYARIYAEHPDRRPAVAQAWFRALLARGDFLSVQRLAGEQLLSAKGTPSPAWAQAFLFANRRLSDAGALNQLLTEMKGTGAHASLLRLEDNLAQTPSQTSRVTLLTDYLAGGPDAFAQYHALRRLLEENRPDLVLSLASKRGGTLGDREKARLQLDALAVAGRDAERAKLVRQLLALPTHPAVCELLSSHLIAHPAPALLADYAAKLAREPLPEGDARYPQLLGFFATCIVHRDASLSAQALDWINTTAGRDFQALSALRDKVLKTPDDLRPEAFLPVLQPLPLEITYAIYDHYNRSLKLAP
jgi:hypothetical protein